MQDESGHMLSAFVYSEGVCNQGKQSKECSTNSNHETLKMQTSRISDFKNCKINILRLFHFKSNFDSVGFEAI